MLVLLGSVGSQSGNAPVDIYCSGDLKIGLCGGWELNHAYNSSQYIFKTK